MRYAAEAPLESVTETYKTKLQHFNFKAFLRDVQNEMKTAKDELNALQAEYKNAIEEEITSRIREQQQQHTPHNITPYFGKTQPRRK